MKNFPFEHNGQTFWYSRSVACSIYVFVYDRLSKGWYILISRRGPGCPSAVGKWNVPGGYLDFDETLEHAAARECFEETGVILGDASKIKLAAVSTDPHSKSQNVVCSFYYKCEVDSIYEVTKMFSTKNGEPGEVSDISLESVDYIFEDPVNISSAFAFGHDKMIREIFKKRIQVPFWKRWIVSLVEKWTRININIQ